MIPWNSTQSTLRSLKSKFTKLKEDVLKLYKNLKAEESFYTDKKKLWWDSCFEEQEEIISICRLKGILQSTLPFPSRFWQSERNICSTGIGNNDVQTKLLAKEEAIVAKQEL